MDKAVDKKKHWAGVFSRAADTYDTVGSPVFAHFGQKLIDLLDIHHNSRILDIACGKGSTIFPALKRLTKGGGITGIDLSEGMIRNLKELLQKNDYDNVEVRLMDAEELEFGPDSFNIVVCGFGIFFFPRVDRVVAEIGRVLKPGGRIGVSTWSSNTGIFEQIRKLHIKYNGLATQGSKEDGQGDSDNSAQTAEPAPVFRTPTGMTEFFESYGFHDIQVREETYPSHYRDKDEWLQCQWTHGWRGLLERLAEQKLLESYRKEIFEILETCAANGEVVIEQRALLTTATLLGLTRPQPPT